MEIEGVCVCVCVCVGGGGGGGLGLVEGGRRPGGEVPGGGGVRAAAGATLFI